MYACNVSHVALTKESARHTTRLLGTVETAINNDVCMIRVPRRRCSRTTHIHIIHACMFRLTSLAQGVLETLGNQLQKLEEEIKADEAGKHEFERQLSQVKYLRLLQQRLFQSYEAARKSLVLQSGLCGPQKRNNILSACYDIRSTK